MLIAFAVLGVIAAYMIWKRSRGEEVPPETKELESRVRRSLQGAIRPISGVNINLVQTSADLMGDAPEDKIGPDEDHVLVMNPEEARKTAAPPELVARREPARRTPKGSAEKPPSTPSQETPPKI